MEASPWRQIKGGGQSNLVPDRQTGQNLEHIPDSAIYGFGKIKAVVTGDTVHNRSCYGWSPYADDNPIRSLDTLPTLIKTKDTTNRFRQTLKSFKEEEEIPSQNLGLPGSFNGG